MVTASHPSSEVSVALQGTLDTFALPDVLRLLAATKKSGRLCITGSEAAGSVWLSAGEVVAVEATDVPHATEPSDALFELLRFEEGAFTFDAEAEHGVPQLPIDVDVLLADAEACLEEWRAIVLVVPSAESWVTLCQELSTDEVTLSQALWACVVAVGSGATVRHIAEELCLSELAVSRLVRDLVQAGMADLAVTADLEPFVPLDLSGHATPAGEEVDDLDSDAPGWPDPMIERAATGEDDEDDEDDLSRQLAMLSPRASAAVRAAAAAGTDEEREAFLSEVDDDVEPLNRGLLLKFLSSVKST